MRTTWKFPLPKEAWGEDGALVAMPVNAGVVHVHDQDGELALWAIVNPEERPVERRYWVKPTGGANPLQGEYVGTAHLGWTVWHVFVEMPF